MPGSKLSRGAQRARLSRGSGVLALRQHGNAVQDGGARQFPSLAGRPAHGFVRSEEPSNFAAHIGDVGIRHRRVVDDATVCADRPGVAREDVDPGDIAGLIDRRQMGERHRLGGKLCEGDEPGYDVYHGLRKNGRVARDEKTVLVVRISEVELDRERIDLFDAGHHEMAGERVVVAGARGRVNPNGLLGQIRLVLRSAHRVGDDLRISTRDSGVLLGNVFAVVARRPLAPAGSIPGRVHERHASLPALVGGISPTVEHVAGKGVNVHEPSQPRIGFDQPFDVFRLRLRERLGPVKGRVTWIVRGERASFVSVCVGMEVLAEIPEKIVVAVNIDTDLVVVASR